MNARELLLTPRGFLIAGGAVLLVLGILGLFVLNNPTLSFFWLDASENIAHIALGAVALAAVYVPGLNDTLRPYYRWIVILVGIIALFFGVYGFIVTGDASGKNTFGLSNLELGDNLLHLVVAVWAFAAAYMTSRESVTASR